MIKSELERADDSPFAHWSLDEALRVMGGDFELLRDVIDQCLADFPEQIAELNQAIDGEKDGAIEHWAHRLKGGLSMLCAEEAFTIALNLEMAAVRQSAGEYKAEFQRLVRCLDELKPELTTLRRELPESLE